MSSKSLHVDSKTSTLFDVFKFAQTWKSLTTTCSVDLVLSSCKTLHLNIIGTSLTCLYVCGEFAVYCIILKLSAVWSRFNEQFAITSIEQQLTLNQICAWLIASCEDEWYNDTHNSWLSKKTVVTTTCSHEFHFFHIKLMFFCTKNCTCGHDFTPSCLSNFWLMFSLHVWT